MALACPVGWRWGVPPAHASRLCRCPGHLSSANYLGDGNFPPALPPSPPANPELAQLQTLAIDPSALDRGSAPSNSHHHLARLDDSYLQQPPGKCFVLFRSFHEGRAAGGAVRSAQRESSPSSLPPPALTAPPTRTAPGPHASKSFAGKQLEPHAHHPHHTHHTSAQAVPSFISFSRDSPLPKTASCAPQAVFAHSPRSLGQAPDQVLVAIGVSTSPSITSTYLLASSLFTAVVPEAAPLLPPHTRCPCRSSPPWP